MAVNFPSGENPGTASILDTAAFAVTNASVIAQSTLNE
jgi:hypothetical protein